MLSEKSTFKWSDEAKRAFDEIKVSIANAPVLAHPNYQKDFIIHFYASEHTISIILLQNDTEDAEVPISFMSVLLKNHELKYSLIEKHAFSVVKEVKHFGYYILHFHSMVFVSNTTVKSILTQQEVAMNNRVAWVSKV